MAIKDLEKYAAMDNIADDLTQEQLDEIGAAVVDDFDNDERSRQDWMSKYEEAMKLAAQVVEEKSYPWPNAANVKFPLLTEAALQFNARAYPALVTGPDIVKARVVGFDPMGEKQESAIRVSKHMSYQLLEQMEEWEENMDKLLMTVPIVGCMFKKTYFDPSKGRNVSIAIYPKDFVVDYDTVSLDSAYRKTHVLHYTANDIQKQVNAGLFCDCDLGEPQLNQPKGENITGTRPVSVTKGTPYKLLEQHTYLDLDDDGIEEPYIITVDSASKKVLRIYAGYDVGEISENEAGDIVEIPQIEYFVKFGFVPSPDGGFYDMGFGQFLGPINKTVDTIINQLLDSGHMSMLGGGFLARGVRLQKGDFSFKPNEWKNVSVMGDDLRKGIVPLPTKEPSAVMFNLLGMMVSQAQRLASTMDSQVGENPGQNQKATTTLAVIEQGSKVFSGIYKRLHRSFKQELRILFKLNSMFIEDGEYFTILDPNIAQEHQAAVLETDYNADIMNIVPAADTSVTSMQQKMAKAQALFELMQTGLVNPQEVVRRNLEAQEQPAIEVLMNVPQQGPSIEEQQLELEKAKYLLDVDIMRQNDIKIRAKAIADLAQAEAAEEGTQLKQYELELKSIIEQSRAVGAKQNAETPEAGSSGMETE